MSTTLRPRTLRQRSAEATARLRDVLDLDDLDLLSTALAEVAADEAAQSPAFANRIRSVYKDLISLKETRPLRAKKTKPADVELVPVGRVEGHEFDPYAPLDPGYLYQLYGAHQLRAALSRYSLVKLKEAAPNLEAQHPGTKLVSRARKDAIIDYIVEQIAGPDYWEPR
jgi:hypothetical protein